MQTVIVKIYNLRFRSFRGTRVTKMDLGFTGQLTDAAENTYKEKS